MTTAISLFPTKFQIKLKFNFLNITSIGSLADNSLFRNITKLHLSNNRIERLEGIQQFKILESLSLSHNQIKDINELKLIPLTVTFLNVDGNPFTKSEFGHIEIILRTFKKLKRLNGQKIDQKFNVELIKQSEFLSRWLLTYASLVDTQLILAEGIYQRKQINKEILDGPNSSSHRDLDLEQLDWNLISRSLYFHNQFSSTIVDSDIKPPTLLQILTMLNQLMKEVCPHLADPYKLNENEADQFKKVQQDFFSLLIKHQTNQNNKAFTNFLIHQGKELNIENGDYFDIFIHLQPSQSHLYGDLWKQEEGQLKSSLSKINQEIPNYLKSKIKRGVSINLIKQPMNIKKQYDFNQYWPIYPFRVDYMQSILFVINDELSKLDHILQQIQSINQILPCKLVKFNQQKEIVTEKGADKQILIIHQKNTQTQKQEIGKEKEKEKEKGNEKENEKEKEIEISDQIPIRKGTIKLLEQKQKQQNTRSIVLYSYIEYFSQVIQKIQNGKQNFAFCKIVKARLNPQFGKVSVVSKVFLLKKCFDILKVNLIKNKKRFQEIRNINLISQFYQLLQQNSQRQKQKKLSAQILFSFVKFKYIDKTLKSLINLKDFSIQKGLSENLYRRRNLNQKTLKLNGTHQGSSQNIQTVKQNLASQNSPSPQRTPRIPTQRYKLGKIALFYDGSAKTCSVCNYEL